ncbi:MAG TPA: hypothetical protein H9684_00360 [Firmicutes bacterium]|nr:hypothetical protein [Bacillota bacterium]
MKIKHLPCGLFPHISTGFQRDPLYAEEGARVTVGCRLDEAQGEADAVLWWRAVPSAEWREVQAEKREDCSRVFSFSCPCGAEQVEYQFKAHDKGGEEESAVFRFSPVHRVTLEAPYEVEHTEREVRAKYKADNTECVWSVVTERDSVFYYNLNVYLTDSPYKSNFTTQNKPLVSPLALKTADGSVFLSASEGTLAELPGRLTLWMDRRGNVYEAEQELMVSGEAVYGLGEKFDAVNQLGKSPLSAVVEQYAHQKDKTYFPIPFFYTDKGVGFLQEGDWRTRFSFRKTEHPDRVAVVMHSRCPRTGRLFSGRFFTGEPAQQLAQYAEYTGMPALPPKWAFGPWMSSNGWNSQQEALEQIRRMNELAIPATVQVLEAWSDEETFYIWNDAQYTPKAEGSFTYEDFTFPPEGKWPDPRGFIQTLEHNGVRLILWQIPVVKYQQGPRSAQLEMDEAYAIQHRLCIRNQDGTPYRITENWFGNSLMPDFTNPETVKWWFGKRKYLLDLGVAGFKTDGGEFLFDESARLFDGRTVEEAHNDYPNQYEGAYHRFLEENLGEGQGVLFSRAGYTGGQRHPIHWAGDQVSEWSELRGQLTAGLSLGLSGVPFWGFDIGGFAGDFPSTELYLRSAAMAAFCPVMQFHSEPRYGQYYMTARDHWNNDRSPWNMAEANRDDRIVPIYRLFANLRMNLLPYLWQEAQHCAAAVRPMMAHLVYDYPNDPAVRELDDEYMLGRNLLVAPIVCEGATGREVYLPQGGWYDLWSGEAHRGPCRVWVSCGLDRLPVFLREGGVLPLNMNHRFVAGETDPRAAVSNRLDGYEELAFIAAGDSAAAFEDEFGNALELRVSGGRAGLEGAWKTPVTVFPWGSACEEAAAAGEENGVQAALQTAEFFGRRMAGRRYSPKA